MSGKCLTIKYQCTHPSCQVFCKKSEINIEESFFNELQAATNEEDTFKSPSRACRMGFAQVFKILSVKETQEGVEAGPSKEKVNKEDPLWILSDEHQHVLAKLEVIEDQVRKRDIEGLWETTALVENDILLHAIKKEEGALFPLIESRISMGEGLVAIMKEDHVEFISILHGFRCGLQDGDIQDGLVTSLIVNLRNHIMKEDEEFFPQIDEVIEAGERVKLYEKMLTLQEGHVPLVAGDRLAKGLSPYSEDRRKMDAEIAALKEATSMGDVKCCGAH
ncbi:MAG: hemerythrin domain-containing protein [Thermodesulfobacteriota bacterium]